MGRWTLLFRQKYESLLFDTNVAFGIILLLALLAFLKKTIDEHNWRCFSND